MSLVLDPKAVKRILDHWFNTPPNGYIGVRYARNVRQILLKPMTEDSSDLLLQWMKEDIPLFRNLSSDQLSIVSRNISFDKKEYFVQVGNQIRVPFPTYTNGAK